MRIDWWTLALQTVNVLILIFILARFFFRPVMAIVARRREEANALLAAAATAREEAAALHAEADKARAAMAAEQERLLAQAHAAAQVERQNLLAQSGRELAQLREEADAAIARDRAAAEAAIIDHASALSVEIAQRLLGRFRHQGALRPFIDEICGAVRDLASEEREGLAAAAVAGQPIAIVTAAALTGAAQQDVRTALAEAFGRDVPLAFRTDPAIIGGIELHGKSTIVRNSWRADLDRIRQELDGARHARES